MLTKFYSKLISCSGTGWKKGATLFDLSLFHKCLFYVNPQLKIYMYKDDNFLHSIHISCCFDLCVFDNNAMPHIIKLFQKPAKNTEKF